MRAPELLHLLLELRPAQASEAAQLHVEDVFGLHLGELEGLRLQRVASGGLVRRGADRGDDLVDEVERLDEALDDVRPVLRLLQAELGAPGDDLHLVLDVVEERVAQVQRARHAVDQRHGVDRERGLHRRALVEVVQAPARVHRA
jgi:hypothetical protein